MDLRTWRKRKLLFLEKWVPLALGQRALPFFNRNGRFSSRPSTRGRSGCCSRRLLRKSKFQHLQEGPRQGRFVDLLDNLGPGWDAGGRRSPARGSTRRPRYRFGLGRSSSGGRRRAPTAMGRLRPGPGDSGGWCITPRQVCWIASVCCCNAENCWAKPSTVSPNSPTWEMGASRKRALSTSFISTRLSQRWRSWTTMVDIAFPRYRAMTFVAHRAKSVAARSSCINPGSVLPSCTCLSTLAW